MNLQRTLIATAVLSVLSPFTFAQTAPDNDSTVVITANPLRAGEGDQILTPARVLSGEELRNKTGSSLGDTLSQELGVSASSFGAGASRPIIRGLEGSRVKMLENGMTVSDVSGLSNDHAVASEASTAHQIEILRGPAALLYGSGAIGGLVNVVNERIPTELVSTPSGEIEARVGSVDNSRGLSASVDGATGKIGLHADGNVRHTDDYRIPGLRNLNDPTSETGRLPHSFVHENTLGFGGSYIDDWGHVGASVASLNNLYGIPSADGSQIDQKQMRYDIDTLVKAPLAGFENFKFKLGYTDYKHDELDLNNVQQTHFANRSLESRWELSHKPIGGWHGVFGIQTENTNFSALAADTGASDTVKPTHSTSTAAFLVEERDFGALRMNAGIRFESVKRNPKDNTLKDRSFNLTSYSVGGAWAFSPGYALGLTGSVAQRAPAIEELYSNGPHDATETFDIGSPELSKETSHNIELSLSKNSGLVRWKVNLFQNNVRNFIYGSMSDRFCAEDGDCVRDSDSKYDPSVYSSRERLFQQQDATIRGAEAEVTYNWRGEGVSLRAFADTSRGTFDAGGNLPLQPATRVGGEISYKQGPLHTGASLIHGFRQDRLASFETTETPAYTQLDAHLSYTQRMSGYDLTWFAVAKNLLNQDIRVSTSLLKDVAPLPGRNFMIGVRTRF